MEESIYDLFCNQEGVLVEPSCMPYIKLLKDNFSLEGTMIDWSQKTKRHVFIGIEISYEEDLDLLWQIIVSCVSSILIKNISLERKIVNFNDDCYDEAIIFDNYNVFNANLLSLVKKFNQRAYFLDEKANWCLCIREQNMIDFAFSI